MTITLNSTLMIVVLVYAPKITQTNIKKLLNGELWNIYYKINIDQKIPSDGIYTLV